MIRRTVESDHDALIELANASGLFASEQTELLSEMLGSPGKEDIWFTDDDGIGPVGVAYMAPEKMTHGTWNLYWIAVHPNQQRQGRGKTMLSYVQHWLMARGERILLVETAGTDDFDYVRRFYANNGFENEARIRDFYDSGVDKIVFRKALAPSNT
ncbi:MAG: GNAT family N-acetyltransferase [Cyanobacteria bacterium P01_D01_bin.156]